MLSVDEDLPAGALVPEGAPLTAQVAALGGLWWSSEPRLVSVIDGAIAGIAPRAGAIALRPVVDNAGSARLVLHRGCEVIAGATGVQAGLVAEHRLACQSIGLIVVFAAPDPARHSLAAVQSDGAGSTAVLGVADGALTLKERKAAAGIEVPLAGAPGAPQIAFVHLGEDMALSRDGHVFLRAEVGDAFAPGNAQLFLGCLRERSGLTMTLGPHRIADLIALPDIDLTASDHAMLRAAFRAYAQEIFADGL